MTATDIERIPLRMTYRALARTVPSESHARKAWKRTSATVLAWEGTAALTKALHKRGALPFSLPFITELVRPLPKPARLAVCGIISLAVTDHLHSQKVF